MICPVCKIRTATIHIIDIDSSQKPLRICKECQEDINHVELFCEDLEVLKEKFTSNKSNHQNNLKYLSIFKNDDSIKKLLLNEETKCSNCGSSPNDFFSKGYLGCEEDYDLFRSVINQILMTLNGTAQHIGKKYYKNPKEKVISRINTLEYNLQKAIEEERYELAGEMTKEIQSLKDSNEN
ncbi:MAG: hypothetical protein COA79_10650 [Planctomycetota bacterium]|nr:MAG: hypothetical protein COA79_10650 [Planctomycetota bacterium]